MRNFSICLLSLLILSGSIDAAPHTVPAPSGHPRTSGTLCGIDPASLPRPATGPEEPAGSAPTRAEKKERKRKEKQERKRKPTEQELQQQKIEAEQRLCDTLYAQATRNIIDGRLGEGKLQLETILTKEYVPATTRINTRILLANLSVNDINTVALGKQLTAISEYCASRPDDVQVKATLDELTAIYDRLTAYARVFERRLCGTWVSTVLDREGIPCVVLHIGRNAAGEFEARIDDACSLARSITAKGADKEHVSAGIAVYGDTGRVEIWFGDEKYRKGNPQLATFGVLLTNEIAKEVSKMVALRHRDNPDSFSAGAALAAVDLVAGLAVMLISELAVKKDHIKTLAVSLDEQAPGMASVRLRYDYYLNRSDNQNSESHYRSSLNLYRANPREHLLFASAAKRAVATQGIVADSSAAAPVLPEALLAEATDEKGKFSSVRFNRAALARLQRRVEERIDDPLLREKVLFDFEQLSQGILYIDSARYYDLYNHEGIYTGLADGATDNLWHVHDLPPDDQTPYSHSWYGGIHPILGEYRSLHKKEKKRFTYNGSWEKGRPHGQGTLTDRKGSYTGEFDLGKRHGHGRQVAPDGTVKEGLWKKDKYIGNQ